MAKLFFIILILCAVATQESYSQKSATAVMQVSVRVIQGTSIDVKQPDLISFNKSKRSNLGEMNLKGINSENALVTVSNSMSIKDKEGNNITLSVSSEYEEHKNRDTIYKLFSSPNELIKSGIYHGKLTTTIEYL